MSRIAFPSLARNGNACKKRSLLPSIQRPTGVGFPSRKGDPRERVFCPGPIEVRRIVTTTAVQPIHAIIPLSVLEAVRFVDALPIDELGEPDPELAAKRLGTSRTVAKQITRYGGLARKGTPVDSDEVVGLLRLVGRRADALNVFADAGRRAAAYAVTQLRSPARMAQRALPSIIRQRLGLALARRAMARSLGAALARDGGSMVVILDDPPSARATPEGTACELYGSAVSAILQALTDLEWVVSHPVCRARGGELCRWLTAPAQAA